MLGTNATFHKIQGLKLNQSSSLLLLRQVFSSVTVAIHSVTVTKMKSKYLRELTLLPPYPNHHNGLRRRVTYLLEKSCSSAPSSLYVVRVYVIEGFYVVSYALGLYIINLLIGFLSPQVEFSDGLTLPTQGTEEFRPFIRRLPEFKFYLAFPKFIITTIQNEMSRTIPWRLCADSNKFS
ncbi:protein RER1B [Sesamum alatum]|uniref:Protein RER1B n=1 Tax=Sesamum alatum TaxID=300844 RepID=A0AAE1XT79_9LAMI|nr:protein RER1B [Sesamum alatum]